MQCVSSQSSTAPFEYKVSKWFVGYWLWCLLLTEGLIYMCVSLQDPSFSLLHGYLVKMVERSVFLKGDDRGKGCQPCGCHDLTCSGATILPWKQSTFWEQQSCVLIINPFINGVWLLFPPAAHFPLATPHLYNGGREPLAHRPNAALQVSLSGPQETLLRTPALLECLCLPGIHPQILLMLLAHLHEG